MARQARLQSPTDYYHIMMRGNNKEKIFARDDLKSYFLDCLTEQYEEGLLDIAAYCIMNNHVHLVIKANFGNLSKALKTINTKYAMRFNYLNDRVGHVFQGRYKSEIIGNDIYLLNVIRYVHNNPIKAKLVKELHSYKWSSFNDYIETNITISGNQKEFVIGCYNSIDKFIEFHKETDNNEYLDTLEEIEEYRMDIAQKIISKYFRDNGINEIIEIVKNPFHIEQLVKLLLNNSRLSQRQIAKLLCISHVWVCEINKQLTLGTVPSVIEG